MLAQRITGEATTTEELAPAYQATAVEAEPVVWRPRSSSSLEVAPTGGKEEAAATLQFAGGVPAGGEEETAMKPPPSSTMRRSRGVAC